MTLAMAVDRRFVLTLAIAVLALTFALTAAVRPAAAARAVEEAKPASDAPKAVDEGSRAERVVVAPEPPHWSGWSEYYVSHPWASASAPRVRVWVDRGEWSTYRPGDRLRVYFRVDRPCYVTILDYAPDGGVSTIYPSRWSGSTFVSPGVTYSIPESRRYSLRIAGTGGIETLVACAHETPWPSGPEGVWIPRHHPNRGRVVVGRPGGSPPPGWRGRIVIGPGHWPVPPAWHAHPEGWSCDSVSFYVEGPYRGDGGYYGDRYGGGPAYGGRWYEEGPPPFDGYPGKLLVHDRFRMSECADRYSVGFDARRVDGMVQISCVASSKGDPTEIVGRLAVEDRSGDDLLFRLDAEGVNGERPEYGRVFTRRWGDVLVEVEVVGFGLASTKSWQTPRIDWIEFDVRVFGD